MPTYLQGCYCYVHAASLMLNVWDAGHVVRTVDRFRITTDGGFAGG